MQDSPITVLIAARNAATTIERAILSVVSQSRAKIILVDDFSTDETASLALRAGLGQCAVVRPQSHAALGATRGFGLSKITTKYTMLLDADDAYLPGRVERAVAKLEDSGSQIWADGVRLRNGNTGKQIREIPVPNFLKKSAVPYRLFERNHLPGIGQVAFLTEWAQRVGYDPTLHGPEDIDLVLRLVASGARISYDEAIGYEMFSYPNSVSRDLDTQLAHYGRCLGKFSSQFIRSLYLEQGSDLPTAIWACVNVSIYSGDFVRALELLNELEASTPVRTAAYVHEPDGPNPFPESWRRVFCRGTIHLALGEWLAAAKLLREACQLNTRPESLNNMGVALRMLGAEDDALTHFKSALELNSSYLDALRNISNSNDLCITKIPLRTLYSRSEYF